MYRRLLGILAALAMFGYTLPPAHLVDTAPAGPPTGHLEQLAAEIPLSATERAMWRELELDLLRRQN